METPLLDSAAILRIAEKNLSSLHELQPADQVTVLATALGLAVARHAPNGNLEGLLDSTTRAVTNIASTPGLHEALHEGRR